MSDWQPIESAPKDGRKILLSYKNELSKRRTVVGIFHKAKTEPTGIECEIAEYDDETDTFYLPEGWYENIESHDEFSSWFMGCQNPTHWMPLPEPPKE